VKHITEHAIVLTFETDLHSTMTITVPNAKPDVTDAEVVEAMTRIIDAEAVVTTAGEPVGIQKAELVSTGTTDYDLA
jgi:CBS domain-containing protein